MSFQASEIFYVADNAIDPKSCVREMKIENIKILVYNNDTNKMETYNKNLNDPMPYSKNRYLTVKEFRGSSKSDVLWTDKRAIEAFNKLRDLYGSAIPVGYAFKRII